MSKTRSLTIAQARRTWAHAQGFGRDCAVEDVPGGWMRSLGSADPYLAMRARVPDFRRDQLDVAMAEDHLWVLPGVRGCIWLMPRDDVSLALRVSAAADLKRAHRDIEKAGGTVDELLTLGKTVLDVLDFEGPMTGDQLRAALPDGSWRSLGDAGKKVGISSTLPPALRLLEWEGKVRRRHVDDRIDHERYRWELPAQDPLSLGHLPADAAEQARELARRFFSWAGPATIDEFIAWSKLGKRASAAAVKALDLVKVEVEGLGAALAFEEGLVESQDDDVHLLPGLDNLLSLRGRTAPLADPTHHDLELPGMGRKPVTVADAGWLQVRPIVRAGEWIGLWEWDPDAQAVVTACFGEVPDGLVAATLRANVFITEQLGGQARSSGIDSAARQGKRAAFVRELAHEGG